MDSNCENRDLKLEHAPEYDGAQYIVSYPHGRNTKEMDFDRNHDFNKKRYPVFRSGNNSGRLKRVVSCKRKMHHVRVAQKEQLRSGKANNGVNKENEMNCMQDMQWEIFDMYPWEFPLNVNNDHKTGTTCSEQPGYCALTELSRNHSTMTDVLFGRNLRLKVALTLWQRNVGELLTYFLRIQDTGMFVDFLPVISRSIDQNSDRITIGCCVDLFPLVRDVLSNPYEEYLLVGLKWINSVLQNWWEELSVCGYDGSAKDPLEKNFEVFNQQLLELWRQEPLLKSVPGPAGDMTKVIDHFLSHLAQH